jgi:hypothetical protein
MYPGSVRPVIERAVCPKRCNVLYAYDSTAGVTTTFNLNHRRIVACRHVPRNPERRVILRKSTMTGLDNGKLSRYEIYRRVERMQRRCTQVHEREHGHAPVSAAATLRDRRPRKHTFS